jgi:hypothetical protein
MWDIDFRSRDALVAAHSCAKCERMNGAPGAKKQLELIALERGWRFGWGQDFRGSSAAALWAFAQNDGVWG